MNVERLAAEYLKEKAHLAALTKQVDELKSLLSAQVDTAGIPDEKGHLWFTAGNYLLQRQKRQGEKFLNKEKAIAWAKGLGIWDDVKVVREDLNEDALLGYVYLNRADEELEAEFKALYEEPPVTWAFMPPVVQQSYEY